MTIRIGEWLARGRHRLAGKAQRTAPLSAGPSHLIAIAATGLTLLILVETRLTIGGAPILAALTFPIIIASYFGGFWPGVTAMLVAGLGAGYFLLAPLHNFEIASTRDRLAVALIVFNSLVFNILIGLNRTNYYNARAANKRINEWLDMLPVGVLKTDKSINRNFLYANDYFCQLLGFSGDEIKKMRARDLVLEKKPEILDNAILHSETVPSSRWDLVKKDGSAVHVEAAAIEWLDGSLLITVSDISPLVATENALAESEQTFATMANSMPLLAWMADPEGGIFWYNARWYEYTGASEADMLGWGWHSVQHPDHFGEVSVKWKEAIEQRKPFEMEFPLKGADGTYRIFLTRAFPQLGENGVVQRWIGTNTDVDDIRRTAAEAQIAAGKIAEQAGLLDESRDAIIVRSAGERIVYWNKGAERLYGWSAEEAIGQAMPELLSPDPATYDKAERALRDHGQWNGEIRKQGKDGRSFILDARWTVIGDGPDGNRRILSIDTDITEQKRVEEQFNRTQRLESIGKLAGGIAHDLNNVFQPISMAVTVLSESSLDGDERSLLDLIGVSARRGADMVRQILGFARGVGGERKSLDVAPIVGEVEQMIRETFPRQYDVAVDVADGLWAVTGDSTQLHQVLLNLCVNARDAMPAGGRLGIRACNMRMDSEAMSGDADVPDGDYVLISVSDSGTGMDAATIEAIFDPFFTTKPISEGTGLGLSTSLSIVRSHGGFIRVYSEVGQGSNFKIFLPAETSGVVTETPPVAAGFMRGDNELVLVVDDEPAIREALRRSLERLGYRVAVAGSGAAALDATRQHAEAFSVVLTDIHMPGMEGTALMSALQRDHPHLPIIAMSGLAEGRAADDFKSFGARAFIAKPFTTELLLETLRRVIEANSTGADALEMSGRNGTNSSSQN